MQPSRKTHLVTANNEAPDAPHAEVRVAKHALIVTLALPQATLPETVVLVDGNTLQVRSLPHQGGLNLTYPLPAECEKGAFVARHVNGVLDVVILRSPRLSQ